ncbi:maleylpyruvate isomerase family mycothiol-dependent enzyme [Streptomyces synnematoformans]|uniref:maleylpyruvate isomerase family mycothiol-dependent enzyme n=1 Tax=Streptomyces synnematoformans TaxID=415721 RepID=UPI0031D62DC7
MTSAYLERARDELRARQGSGAREDAEGAPHTELYWARTGTAYFARKLGELPDSGPAGLDGPSLLPGWDRRAVTAHVGYNARALTRLCTWARTGVVTPMYGTPERRAAEIAEGASQPARALRHLVAHAGVHLNVEWRDLPPAAWDAEVRTAQGRTVPCRETAWMRAREVWIHAVDLGNGGTFHDLPSAMLDRLADDVLAAWRRRGESPPPLALTPTDRAAALTTPGTAPLPVTGAMADVVRWLTGRGARGLTAPAPLPALPRWF